MTIVSMLRNGLTNYWINIHKLIFKTMKDVFMMSVYLGTRLGKPKELDGKKMSPFKGNLLSHDEQLYLLSAAIGWKKDPNVIADPQQVVRIAEQFANAGVWKLDEILSTSAEGPLWDLVDHFHTELESV
jgi:hypothetical protein